MDKMFFNLKQANYRLEKRIEERAAAKGVGKPKDVEAIIAEDKEKVELKTERDGTSYFTEKEEKKKEVAVAAINLKGNLKKIIRLQMYQQDLGLATQYIRENQQYLISGELDELDLLFEQAIGALEIAKANLKEPVNSEKIKTLTEYKKLAEADSKVTDAHLSIVRMVT